ncbi:hypothetical protein ANCCEY_11872 [Ancylostoma ceylanicum]|uniref:Uncharacterized protein n=1 Tax=Ancylostoma ceylanicum TaxID=53326 RepID=A0A0D6LAI5_9BILA|nr:hypothetical protein ANCCEY_11872 [Ancylostoma ceylanicum]
MVMAYIPLFSCGPGMKNLLVLPMRNLRSAERHVSRDAMSHSQKFAVSNALKTPASARLDISVEQKANVSGLALTASNETTSKKLLYISEPSEEKRQHQQLNNIHGKLLVEKKSERNVAMVSFYRILLEDALDE